MNDVPPVRREFNVTPEFIVALSKGGSFRVVAPTLPRDAIVVLELTRWDDAKKRLTIVVESALFPDIVEEIPSPRFEHIADT